MRHTSLFRRRGLLGRRSIGVGRFALLVGVAQKPVDDTSTLLLLDAGFLRFLLLGEEPVICFPAHCVLHPRWNQRHDNSPTETIVPATRAVTLTPQSVSWPSIKLLDVVNILIRFVAKRPIAGSGNSLVRSSKLSDDMLAAWGKRALVRFFLAGALCSVKICSLIAHLSGARQPGATKTGHCSLSRSTQSARWSSRRFSCV